MIRSAGHTHDWMSSIFNSQSVGKLGSQVARGGQCNVRKRAEHVEHSDDFRTAVQHGDVGADKDE